MSEEQVTIDLKHDLKSALLEVERLTHDLKACNFRANYLKERLEYLMANWEAKKVSAVTARGIDQPPLRGDGLE